jgi:subtilisin-like proprotein convertase family protein
LDSKHRIEPGKEVYVSSSKITTIEFMIDKCTGDESVRFLEHVELTVNIDYTRRGDLKIDLISPNGMSNIHSSSSYRA